jgi:hypothetical protein
MKTGPPEAQVLWGGPPERSGGRGDLGSTGAIGRVKVGSGGGWEPPVAKRREGVPPKRVSGFHFCRGSKTPITGVTYIYVCHFYLFTKSFITRETTSPSRKLWLKGGVFPRF